MVGIVRPPFWSSSTKRRPSASSSISIHSYGTRCSARNFLERLQSGHHGAPYTFMSAIDQLLLDANEVRFGKERARMDIEPGIDVGRH